MGKEQQDDKLFEFPLHAALAPKKDDDNNHQPPVSSKKKDKDETPHPLDVAKIQELITKERLSQADNQGALPLHIAAKSGTPIDIVRQMIDLYPDALYHETHMGYLPLHWAIHQILVIRMNQNIKEAKPPKPFGGRNDDDDDDDSSNNNNSDNEEEEQQQEQAQEEQQQQGEDNENNEIPNTEENGEGDANNNDNNDNNGDQQAAAVDENTNSNNNEETRASNEETAEETNEKKEEEGETTTKKQQEDEEEEDEIMPTLRILKLFLEKAPQTAAYSTSSGNHENAMHSAVRNGASLDLLVLLHEACPEAICGLDKDGLPPLRHATQLPVLEFLCKAYPGALELMDVHGNWLVDRLVNDWKYESVDRLDFLLQQDPGLMTKPRTGGDGGTLLHRVIGGGVSTPSCATVKWLVEKDPTACTTPDKEQCLPIHLICPRLNSDDAIPLMELLITGNNNNNQKEKKDENDGKAAAEEGNTETASDDDAATPATTKITLLEKDPSILRIRNKDGKLPVEQLFDYVDPQRSSYTSQTTFDCAARGVAQFRQRGVEWMIKQCPECLRLPHPETGMLPIHTAIHRGRHQLVQVLAEGAPDTLMKIAQGCLPIHMILQHKWNYNKVQGLFELQPNVAFVPDAENRRLLLHWLLIQGYFMAEKNRVDLGLIKDVYHAFPQATLAQDREARVPMHYAAFQGTLPLELMNLLIEWWPEGLIAADSHGWLPIELACQADCELDLIYAMIQANPQQVVMMCNKKWKSTLLTMAPRVSFSLGSGVAGRLISTTTTTSSSGNSSSNTSDADSSGALLGGGSPTSSTGSNFSPGTFSGGSSTTGRRRRIVRARRPAGGGGGGGAAKKPPAAAASPAPPTSPPAEPSSES